MAHQRTNDPGSITATGIPVSLRASFQEYDFEQLDPAQHSDLIIERTLAYGNRAEVYWLLQYYGRLRVMAWIQQFGERQLRRRRYNLWCVLFKLPPAQRVRPKGSQIWPY